MRQLSLFDDAPPSEGYGRLDVGSEGFLEAFAGGVWMKARAPLCAAGDITVALARPRVRGKQPPAPTCGGLRRPRPDWQGTPRAAGAISRSTGRTRLRAIHRFMRIVGPRLGRVPEADVAALDALLPARPDASWHSAGTLVAGTAGRRRRRGPTLDGADLQRIVDAVGNRGVELDVRDRALAAVACFSGLRIEEALALRWRTWRRVTPRTGTLPPPRRSSARDVGCDSCCQARAPTPSAGCGSLPTETAGGQRSMCSKRVGDQTGRWATGRRATCWWRHVAVRGCRRRSRRSCVPASLTGCVHTGCPCTR
jgi:hypothetical protein